MEHVNLQDADLRYARLDDANLHLANLIDADLTGATYTDDTRWSAGFNPERAGAIRRLHT